MWNGDEGCWRLVQRWDRWYPLYKQPGGGLGRWQKDCIVLSVMGEPDRYEASLLARVSNYATRVTALERMISDYLVGREVRVYDTAWEGAKVPTDVNNINVSSVVHPAGIRAELAEISILDLNQPERVQVWVETCYPRSVFQVFCDF